MAAFAGVPEIEVTGLSEQDARSLFASAFPGPLDEKVADRVIADGEGNPRALLELPRGFSPAELAGGFWLPTRRPLRTGSREASDGNWRRWLKIYDGCCWVQTPRRKVATRATVQGQGGLSETNAERGMGSSGRTMNVDHLIAHYGYIAVFGFVAIESLGIPLPGETALITAGIYAGSTHRLSPWLIWLVASAGAIVGDNIGYFIGDKGG